MMPQTLKIIYYINKFGQTQKNIAAKYFEQQNAKKKKNATKT